MLFDDRSWNQATPESFIPLIHERFYRYAFQASNNTLASYPSFELYVRHFYCVEIFINNKLFLSQTYNDSSSHETIKRGGFSSYIASSPIVVAIHVFSHNSTQPITDDCFSAHMVFLTYRTPSSTSMLYDSDHHRDFPNHPLEMLFDESRLTSWLFYGDTANVTMEFTNVVYVICT